MKNKITKILIIMLIIISCKREREYYQGIITDEQSKPLYHVRIEKINTKADNPNRFTYTNKEGYFKLKTDINVISNISISKKVYNKRIIRPIRPISGEYLDYTFLKEIDTVIIHKSK